MLNETQHARSEDEAQELEAAMHGNWWQQTLAAVGLLVGAAMVAFFMGITMLLAGLLAGCAPTKPKPSTILLNDSHLEHAAPLASTDTLDA